MKHESHWKRLDTKLTTCDSTVWKGSAAAMRLPISWRKSMSDRLVTEGSISIM
jgi:hypothetical protein